MAKEGKKTKKKEEVRERHKKPAVKALASSMSKHLKKGWVGGWWWWGASLQKERGKKKEEKVKKPAEKALARLRIAASLLKCLSSLIN